MKQGIHFGFALKHANLPEALLLPRMQTETMPPGDEQTNPASFKLTTCKSVIPELFTIEILTELRRIWSSFLPSG